ncbi:MAG TPA: GAF domain-containing sensor histidine kinase [Aggregatilineales bacterium]|nr:GAF domain-containing protein [Anaerolineae bacterium]HUN05365.1 GAF domain-containing sensor histidine kinase [Aggregatilineales bacterium]
MTTDQLPAIKPISDHEMATLRHSMNLLKSQIASGRLDASLLTKQVHNAVEMLERLDAERQESRRAARYKALYNVTRLMGSSLDLQTVLDQVMDAIIQLTGAERGFLMLRDDDGGLSVKAARNLDQQTLGSEQFKFSRTIANQVLDDGKPVLTTNAVEDPRFAGQMSIVGQGLRAVMATPLRARGKAVGVVYVDSRLQVTAFNQEDLDALDAFAGQAAIAIENARLFSETDQELAERVEQLQQLRRIDTQLGATLDASKAIALTLEWSCRLSGSEIGHFGLISGDPPHVRAVQHYGVQSGESAPELLDEVFPSVEQMMVENLQMTIRLVEGETALAVVPIPRENRLLGVVVIRRSGAEAFSDEQVDMIERMMARAAVAIENAQLYARVQAADKAKSEFVGIVAHDLKVPMTSIAGYADLTRLQGGLSERQTEFIQKVKDTVKRMEILVSDLADISRIESGHFFMNETRVPVAQIVQAVKDGTLTQMQQYGHEYVEEVAPNLPDMRADYYRLLQVLTNLVSNAYKYTPDGGRVIFRVFPDGDRVGFSVADTGIGLTAEQIARLGTRFWRAEDDFTRSRPGTGLGFAITRSLVEQMGSRILIESTPGKGSSFTFSVTTAPDGD